MVQFSPRKIQEIESLLAERELWMTVGVVALARHQTLQPHRRVSLSLAARLFDLASKLGRLTVGPELCPSQTRARCPRQRAPNFLKKVVAPKNSTDTVRVRFLPERLNLKH